MFECQVFPSRETTNITTAIVSGTPQKQSMIPLYHQYY